MFNPLNWFKEKLGINKIISNQSEISKDLERIVAFDFDILAAIEKIDLRYKEDSLKFSSLGYKLDNFFGENLRQNKEIKNQLETLSLANLKKITKDIDVLKELVKQQENKLIFEITKKDYIEQFNDLKELSKEDRESLTRQCQSIKKLIKDIDVQPIIEVKVGEKQKEEINLDIKDKTFYRNILNNKVKNIHNLTDIKNIPPTYQVLDLPIKNITGNFNNHCYDNSIASLRGKSEIVYIGIIISKAILSDLNIDKIKITPYLHAWNISSKGEIIDYTLGDKGNDYIYIGRSTKGEQLLTAEQLEKTLQKEVYLIEN